MCSREFRNFLLLFIYLSVERYAVEIMFPAGMFDEVIALCQFASLSPLYDEKPASKDRGGGLHNELL